MRQNEYDEIDKPWRTCQHETTDIYLDDSISISGGEYQRMHGVEICVDCEKERLITMDLEIIIKNRAGDWNNG